MFQNLGGRPRKREKDALDTLRILKDADWGMGHRKIALELDRPDTSIYRALLLAAGVIPEDYERLGLELALEHILTAEGEIKSVKAAREGIARWENNLGGWYWWENEEDFWRKWRARGPTWSEYELAKSADEHEQKAVAMIGLITRNRVLRWLARRSPALQDSLQYLEKDPEGRFRQIGPDALDFMKTPAGMKLAKTLAALRLVKDFTYTEEDIETAKRTWRRPFELRNRLKKPKG